MKRLALYFLLAAMVLSFVGCAEKTKDKILQEAKNDHTMATVGGNTVSTTDWRAYPGDGYRISIPKSGFHYEFDFDDSVFEETWEAIAGDDAQVQVTMYKNSDETSARGRFLREHEDYVFEDFTGETHCGTERDGDTLWFRVYPSEGAVYILSWEYTKNTSDDTVAVLNAITKTFELTK